MNKLYLFLILTLTVMFLISCGENYTPEQAKYVAELEQYRQEMNDYMEKNSNSPFNSKSKVEFHDLNYFDPNFDFIFHSKLTEYEKKDTVVVYGTKGEPRQAVRYGYLTLNYKEQPYKLNVYESFAQNGQIYYSLWFTDKTTNDETYGVGRYIHFELNDDPNHVYTIDFNYAFNPYCAYSKEYSCAIPRKEDFINIAIEAGEKKFHD